MKPNLTKNIFILTLSFLVMLNSVGVFLVNYLEVGFHRAIEYSNQSATNSESLFLTADEFKSIAWLGERDFIYEGRIYDCNSISSSKGKILISCHSDKEETNLKNALATNFDGGSKNMPSSKSAKDFFKVFPVFPLENGNFIFTSQVNSSLSFSHFSNSLLKSAELSLNTPPPEIG